ncbi:MAG: hypothetical protein MK078_07655 [Crocinitomicaceae bacterium]|nr:hypothetical protein [Crocinitomicaceae bacterium]
MLKKLLFAHKSNLQFVFATLGTLIGLTSLLLSAQLILDVQSFQSNEEELFGPNSVVIQKKVTKLTTIGMNSTEFTPEDIKGLEEKEFITDVAPFQSSDFKVGISEVEGDGLPHFYADMFFQAIPDRFMDVKNTEWEWNVNSEYIPIVLPRDFIMIINYGFAQSQGINQISEELLMAARLQIYINGNGQKTTKIGRVVGFSQKISSILVPEDFLKIMNKQYGNGNILNPSRVFITIKDDSYGELEELMEEHNLDINQSAIDVVKIKTIVAVVIGIFGIAAILIMLLSLLGFIQYSQLVLSKASYEIRTLLRIGYAVRSIVKTFIKQLSLTFGIITISAIGIMFAVKLLVINPWLEDHGISIGASGITISLFIGIISLVLFIVANYLNISRTVKRLGNE